MEEKGADALEMAKKTNEKKEKAAQSQVVLNIVTDERLEKYFSITGEAIKKVKIAGPISIDSKKVAEDFLDMAKRYYSDAKHFREKGDIVTAFAALNYAHGFLDAGARMKIFDVHDSRLFASD